MLRTLLLFVFAVGLVSCLSTSEPLPFAMSMQVSKTTAAPGDTILILVNSQGSNIINMVVTYDDGDTTQFAVGGARSAQGIFPHAFATAGTFRIRAKVTNAIADQLENKTDSIDVHVQ